MKLMVISTNLNRKNFLRPGYYLKDTFKDIELIILSPKLHETGNHKASTFGKVERYKDEAKRIGLKMRERCVNCFDVEHLAKCFSVVLHEFDKGIYNDKHIDTADKWEELND